MGLLPCTWNLPLRFTQNLEKKNKVVKYARGRLVGWELQDVGTERVAGNTDAEFVLTRMPRRLFVQLTTNSLAASEKQGAAYICASTPKKVVWYRAAACTASVVRLGFPVVADFAGTIHSYTGENLPTGSVDLDGFIRDVALGHQHPRDVRPQAAQVLQPLLLDPHL